MRPERRLPFWKRRFYVHPLQRKYFFLSLIPLAASAVLLIVLLFLPLQVAYTRSAFEPEKALIMHQALLLVSRIWPAIILTMIAYAIATFFVLHKLVGPLPRMERLLRGIAKGDLPPFIRVRPKDDLEEFAAHLDQAFRTLFIALKEIRDQEARAAQELAEVRGKLGSGGAGGGDLLKSLEEIRQRHQEIGKILSYFSFPAHLGQEGKEGPRP
ncbi:MAG: methyl-accepting chemotaxis protein [candidate division NC10 bacterium]|nr:methyl-accepting chemotaxis protein [candidate division NC10 bacterium]